MFWVIYKNLEKEIIELSNKLHFCDKQEKVYSIYISDLLIRISVEIEALSKELYKIAGGNMKPLDDEGNERDLMFDSDCIHHLMASYFRRQFYKVLLTKLLSQRRCGSINH